MTIPGDLVLSGRLLVVSEVGEISRFEDSSSLVAYAGLAPSTHSSGGKTYHGPIMKSGSRYLRWAMGQCARAHMRKSNPTGRSRHSTPGSRRKKGDQKAIVAASAKLLKMVILGPKGEEGVSQI